MGRAITMFFPQSPYLHHLQGGTRATKIKEMLSSLAYLSQQKRPGKKEDLGSGNG